MTFNLYESYTLDEIIEYAKKHEYRADEIGSKSPGKQFIILSKSDHVLSFIYITTVMPDRAMFRYIYSAI